MHKIASKEPSLIAGISQPWCNLHLLLDWQNNWYLYSNIFEIQAVWQANLTNTLNSHPPTFIKIDTFTGNYLSSIVIHENDYQKRMDIHKKTKCIKTQAGSSMSLDHWVFGAKLLAMGTVPLHWITHYDISMVCIPQVSLKMKPGISKQGS